MPQPSGCYCRVSGVRIFGVDLGKGVLNLELYRVGVWV